MRLKQFKRLNLDNHLRLVNKYGHEVAYISEFTTMDTSKYDDCVVVGVYAREERVLDVMLIRDRLPNVSRKRGK